MSSIAHQGIQIDAKKMLKALFTLQLCITPAHCCLSLERSQLKKYQVGWLVTQLGDGTAWGVAPEEDGPGKSQTQSCVSCVGGRKESQRGVSQTCFIRRLTC